jgi:hypothetical protein
MTRTLVSITAVSLSLLAAHPVAAIELESCNQQTIPELEKRVECLQRNVIALSKALEDKVATLNKEHEDKFVRYGVGIAMTSAVKPEKCLVRDEADNTYVKAFFGPCENPHGGPLMRKQIISRY